MTDPLPFTGERFTPECVREIWYEHWHRYAFARQFAAGKRVLDAACGEGYGAALLAARASSVLGVDVSEETLAHARSRYGDRANLRFERGDVTRLDLPPASFDLIVSVETLEHVHEHEAMLAGFARLLAPGGLLLISTPDRRTYSDVSGFRNEHHVRELYREEFEALLAREFPAVRLFGQKLLFQSAIWSLGESPRQAQFVAAAGREGEIVDGTPYAPLYYVALCARAAVDLPASTQGLASLFGDTDESVYAHYQAEIRHHIDSGAAFADMERRLAEAEARLAAMTRTSSSPGASASASSASTASRSWWQRLTGR